MLITPREGCWKPPWIFINHRKDARYHLQDVNCSTRWMLETTLDVNYNTRGMLETTQDAYYFTQEMLETTLNANYST